MKIINLSNGMDCRVDDEDFEELIQYNWHLVASKNNSLQYAKRHVRINGKTTSERMHRRIMGVTKGLAVDHRDGDGLNNQKYNLRICTYAENNANRGRQRNQTNKHIGVNRSGKWWQARIWSKGKTILIGKFKTEMEAVRARDAKALELRGDYAKLNVQPGLRPVEEK